MYSPKRLRIDIALGVIILVVGIAGTIYFGSIDITQIVKKNANQQTGLLNTVNGIPHAQAQVGFEILIFIDLFALGYGTASHYTRHGIKTRQ